MDHTFPKTLKTCSRSGFTLVEMLVVVAIIAILMTAGTIGLGNLGGKGVSSGVDSAEAIFDEARSMATAENIRTAVLVSRQLTNKPAEDRRRILVVKEEVDNSGNPVSPDSASPRWEITSRGTLLPEKTFFSERFSVSDHEAGAGEIPFIEDSRIINSKAATQGTYYVYQFNSQGAPWNPAVGPNDPNGVRSGASFVIASGTRRLARSALDDPPRVVGSSRKDFGGFVIWKNGATSVFRSPAQVSPAIDSISAGENF